MSWRHRKTRCGEVCRSELIGLAQYLFQVFFRCGNGGDVVVFYEEVQDIRRYEGRQRRAEVNVLESQVQEREENADGLLLVPGRTKVRGRSLTPQPKASDRATATLMAL